MKDFLLEDDFGCIKDIYYPCPFLDCPGQLCYSEYGEKPYPRVCERFCATYVDYLAENNLDATFR